jgi:hypothetical protein
MDFSNRAGQSRPQQAGAHANVAAGAPSQGTSAAPRASRRKVIGGPKWFRVTLVTLVACIAVLAIALTFSFVLNGQGESKYVNNKEYQAVFLNNGQVYFGKVKSLTDHYMDVTNIFYLSTQQAQPETSKSASAGNKFSLVKLGCELHGPEDQMLINKGQVTFWENLRGNGQVMQAIDKWYQQNPNGLQCNTSNS